MLKTVIIATVIAITVAVGLPRDRHEAASLAIRAGIGLIWLGLALDSHGHEAGLANPDDERDLSPPTEDARQAGVRVGTAHKSKAE